MCLDTSWKSFVCQNQFLYLSLVLAFVDCWAGAMLGCAVGVMLAADGPAWTLCVTAGAYLNFDTKVSGVVVMERMDCC